MSDRGTVSFDTFENERYEHIAWRNCAQDMSAELLVLRQAVRKYLAHPSSDGHMNRKQLRKELAELTR